MNTNTRKWQKLPSNDIASSKSISIQDCHLMILPQQKKHFSSRLPSNDIATSKYISVQDCHLMILPHQNTFQHKIAI